MTESQYNWVNQIRLAHGYSPLARRYKDTGRDHQAKQIARALKVCSPVRRTFALHSPKLGMQVEIDDGYFTRLMQAPL